MRDRLLTFQAKLQPNQACLLSSPFDITYFTGCAPLLPEEREAFLIIMKEKSVLLLSGFSPFQADIPAHQALSLTVHTGVSPLRLKDHVAQLIKIHQIAELLIDKDDLTVSEAEALAGVADLQIKGLLRQWVWQLRSLKNDQEKNLLRQAGAIAARVADQAESWFKLGMSELELSYQIQDELRRLGSEREAFPTIVAFGANSALPHHQPSNAKLTKETAVLVDFGATIKGYRSDMTRMFWFGQQPNQEFFKLKRVVEEAYQAVLRVLQEKFGEKEALNSDPLTVETHSLTAADLDEVARKIITEAGYGGQFIHTTGHGVGLDIHEFPSLNSQEHTPILPGMTITIEPGIYLEGKFGYRLENTVLVTETGAEVLTEIRLSDKNDKRYNQMIKDFLANKNVGVAESVDELITQLHQD